MRNIINLIAASFLLLCAGCVPSLNPLYTDQDVIFDPALLGVWAEKDSKETWELSQTTGKQYRLIYTEEDGKKGEFTVHLLKVEGQTFLDLFPAELTLPQGDYYKGHFLPSHTFILLSNRGAAIQMSYLEPEWLMEFLTKNPAAIQHEKVGDRILLTASPKELQKFLLANLKTKGAFSPMEHLERKTDNN